MDAFKEADFCQKTCPKLRSLLIYRYKRSENVSGVGVTSQCLFEFLDAATSLEQIEINIDFAPALYGSLLSQLMARPNLLHLVMSPQIIVDENLLHHLKRCGLRMINSGLRSWMLDVGKPTILPELLPNFEQLRSLNLRIEERIHLDDLDFNLGAPLPCCKRLEEVAVHCSVSIPPSSSILLQFLSTVGSQCSLLKTIVVIATEYA